MPGSIFLLAALNKHMREMMTLQFIFLSRVFISSTRISRSLISEYGVFCITIRSAQLPDQVRHDGLWPNKDYFV